MSFKSRLPFNATHSYPLPGAVFALIAAMPLFLVTVRGWASVILYAAGVGAIACLPFRRLRPPIPESEMPATRMVAATLLLPVLAILLSSAFRGKFSAPLFDSPSRFLIAIPILLLVVRYRFSAARWLQYTIPAALVITAIQLQFFEGPVFWMGDRMATYFADPLTFGQYMVTFALMSLVSINLLGRDGYALIAFKCVAAALGFYLSIRSGSRTGWLAVPIVIVLLMLPRNRKLRWRDVVIAVVAAFALLVASYRLSPTVHERADAALHDYTSYNLTGIAPDTSVGLRLTFLRIGAHLVATHPLDGLGDNGFASALNAPDLESFASPFARDFALHAGFHNEVMTNAVRSGVWGIVETFALFIVPLAIFGRAIRSRVRERVANGTLGLVFMICQIVSGMTTEVFNLKFTASFAALFIAALCGASIVRHGQE